jgi:hypothetical protein
MNDRERMAWLMSVCLMILSRPGPMSGDAELDQNWTEQLARLMAHLPSCTDFRKEAP